MKIVAYYRVSTQKQGESGLGLEAQQAAVSAHARACSGKIVAEFTEIESGRKTSRPKLTAAIAAARQHGATLVVAKLDRLSRNAAFTAALLDSGLEFVACDNPHANRLTIQILAAIAEHEARLTSQRTRDALAALKASGQQLGNPNPRPAARKGNAANAAAAAVHATDVLPIARKKRAAGKTLQEIADFLTGRGLLTRRGKRWTPVAVMRLLAS